MEASVAFEIAQRAMEGKPRISVKQRRTNDVIRRELKFLFELSSRVGSEGFRYESEIEIDYRKDFCEVERRRILTNSLFMFSNEIYLNAFCHQSQKDRTFKRSRILGIRSLNGGVSPDYDRIGLDVCDFFVHPRTWGDYRKPCSIILRKMMDKSIPKTDRFHILFQFVARSLERGVWSDFYKESNAAGVVLLALGTDLKGYKWRSELESVRGGRFDKAALRQAIAFAD